jgi:hypothetical protein
MRIRFRQPRHTADISSAQGSAFSELWKMILSAVVLLVGLYFLWGVFVDAVVACISFETEAKIFMTIPCPIGLICFRPTRHRKAGFWR